MRHLLQTLAILTLVIPALLTPTTPPAFAKKGDKKGGKTPPAEEEKKDEGKLNAGTFAGLSLRGIGPALTSGRIIDVAIDHEDSKIWYVGTAGGGVWKTVNGGTTFSPIFDSQASASIGCITIDPNNPHVIWVGSGENNSQRSVGYGDGVYKSLDGGKNWKRMGLETSEHIGKIIVDPRDSDVVYVAAQGPLWSAGGERGLYKTVDGGETWKSVLEISEHTGVSDLVMDPRDPDVLIAAAYQRRRRVWTLINGGPESGVHKSTDGGETWRKIGGGLPGGDVGRIGLAMSPVDPDVIYAIIEAQKKGGFYRSTDRGESWSKRSSYVSGSPQYYQEIIADPHDVDRVYSNDVWMQVTEDGGSSFNSVPETHKHVDNHSLWIDPASADHLINGCDGGLYESWDRGKTWRFISNLSVTQFYRVEVDYDTPFYNVYGGTQDNFSLGGPSRTERVHGILNSDWFVTLGGDGFQTRVDPTNPDIVYSQLQHGVLVRYDRKSGEAVDIRPQSGPDEDGLRFNWDSPLIISPHSPSRLYFAAQRLFRSNDRGDSWTAISDDLTRQIDRNTLEIMGKVWSIDAVSKNRSTSMYGNLVSLTESPKKPGLIYVGTDDGLVRVTEDDGGTWRKIESFPGVPERTYVNDLFASRHDENTVYAAFNNHKSGDFKPYLLKSTDRGATWTSIAGDPEEGGLPERGSTYTVVEDHEKPELLFVGTEFGVYFSIDGGGKWVELSGNMPTVAVRDIEIQTRENDLVLATFGRGFYILDDYSPLRHISAESLEEEEARLFPVKDAWIFNPSYPLGLRGKSFQGDGFFSAPNPPLGATFTYYLAESIETLKEKRQKAEKELIEDGENVAYPARDDLRAELREESPAIILTVTDTDGHVIRRLEGPAKAGMHRVTWDLRFPSPEPVSLKPWSGNAFQEPPIGPLAAADTYRVALSKREGGEETAFGQSVEFKTVPLGIVSMPAADQGALLAFQRKVARLQRALMGVASVLQETNGRLALLKKTAFETPDADAELRRRVRQLELDFTDLSEELFGDPVAGRIVEAQAPSILRRIGGLMGGWSHLSAPTPNHRQSYEVAAQAFEGILATLRQLVEGDLKRLEDDLEAVGAPWTPGRLPTWTHE